MTQEAAGQEATVYKCSNCGTEFTEGRLRYLKDRAYQWQPCSGEGCRMTHRWDGERYESRMPGT